MGEINHVLVGYRFLVARNKTPIVERHLTKINGKKQDEIGKEKRGGSIK